MTNVVLGIGRLLFAVWILAISFSVTVLAAEPIAVTDIDSTVIKFSKMIEEGDTSKLALELSNLVGSPEQKANFESSFGYLKGKKSDVTDRVFDKTYGTTIRRIVMYHAYSDLTVLYVRYTAKRFQKGWILVNFDYKTETTALFPPDYISP